MPRATLPATARLHRPSEFAAALKGRRLARGAFFVVSAAPNDLAPGQEPGARLGLIIAKRFAQRAVTRNAVKRVIREAVRTQRPAMQANDYVVRLHSKVPQSSLTALKHAARAEIDAHFRRITR